MIEIRNVLDKVLVFTELAASALMTPGAQAPAVARLLAYSVDLAQSVLATDEELAELAAFWQAHNDSGKPLTVEVAKEIFAKAKQAHANVQSFRSKFALPPAPTSLLVDVLEREKTLQL